MKVKTVLFDLDGTLIDSREDLSSAVNYALRSTGQPEKDQDQIVPHVGNGLNVLLNNVMGPVSEKTLEAAISFFSDFYDRHCVDKTILYPGVEQVLNEFHSRVKMGVVTNKPYRFSRKILDRLKVGRYFGAVIGGDSTPHKKPHPEPILKAIADLKGLSNETLILGDGSPDILGGQASHVQTCVAKYGYGFSKELIDLEPDFAINEFIELKEIVL